MANEKIANKKIMLLEIVSPEKTIFKGEVESITLPGTKAAFTILNNHAPMISSLTKGIIRYKIKEKEEELPIEGGFIEVTENSITVCLDVA